MSEYVECICMVCGALIETFDPPLNDEELDRRGYPPCPHCGALITDPVPPGAAVS